MAQDYYRRNHAHQGIDVDGSSFLPAAKIGDVAAGNYTEIEADGSMFSRGDATMYDDINYKFSTGKVSGLNQPVWTLLTSPFYAYTFAVNDTIQCPAEEIRHNWKQGTDIEIHAHIVTNGSNTTDRYVKHQVKIMWSNSLSSGGTPSTMTIVTPYTAEILIPANTPDRTHIVSHIGTIPMSTGLTGAYIGALYTRILATGTAPTNNPFVIAVGLHYQIDSLGSRTMYTK